MEANKNFVNFFDINRELALLLVLHLIKGSSYWLKIDYGI